MEKNSDSGKFPMLIMAGGTGSRMDFPDKGILMVKGKTLIDRNVDLLSQYTENAFIATTKSTVITKEYYYGKFPVLETEGRGYSEDLSDALSKIGTYPILVVPSDLYIYHPEVVNRFMKEALYRKKGVVSMLIGGIFSGFSLYFSKPQDVDEDHFYYINFTERDACNVNTRVDYYLLLNKSSIKN
ncbi:MAG: NTP transferase domain-containing protein [Candidatus Thermoplasmatota archaeon]|jgi:GTP:adenosylcobinamide-phosphate guanylyltransferase|nr:NTP transferase domain-containing protein [Candidatus Thermoplasmatota archaeon]